VIRAVIFDCDGVLFDSWRANVAYYNAVLAALGLAPLDADGERLAHVLSSPQLYAMLFGDEPRQLEQVQAVARGVDYGPFYQWMEPVPGLHDLLAELKTGYRVAVATNRGATLPGVIERFGLRALLDLAVGIYDVARPKPFPDMIEKCITHFGIAPDEAVYVGDTTSDYQAARAAGAHFIGVGEQTGAAVHITRLTELPPLLARWPT
jgi:phosphoglycolate phosphatase